MEVMRGEGDEPPGALARGAGNGGGAGQTVLRAREPPPPPLNKSRGREQGGRSDGRGRSRLSQKERYSGGALIQSPFMLKVQHPICNSRFPPKFNLPCMRAYPLSSRNTEYET